MRCAAGRDALAILSANDESTLLVVRNHYNAGSTRKDGLRNTLVGDRHHFVHNGRGGIQPVIELRILRMGRKHASRHRQGTKNSSNFLHHVAFQI